MQKTTTLFFLLLFVFFAKQTAFGQCNTSTCTDPVPSVNAQDACVLPYPSALDCYYGSTTPDPPVSFPPSWCSVIHNNHWFAFTADAPSASFEISCYGCASGNGIQAAVLSTNDCVNFNFVSPCLGNIPTQTTQTLVASPLVPGEVYYICIDGSGGALCDYSINGSVPTVNGPANLCLPISTPSIYTTQAVSGWTIEPGTAGTIVGNPISNSISVIWNEPGPAQVCAQNVNCPNSPNYCLDVNIGQDVTTNEFVDVCQGSTVECAGQNFSAGGIFPVTLNSYNNCDSIVRCNVHLIPRVYSSEDVYMCQGQSVPCAGEEFNSPGNYNVTLQAWQGCDSIVTCKVHIIPPTIPPIQIVTLCGPTEYPICGTPYDQSGLVTETCQTWQGCDSIVTVNLAILNPIAAIAPPAIIDCNNNVTITLNGTGSNVNTAIGGTTSYLWSGPGIVGLPNQSTVQVNQPGEYCLVLTHGRFGLFCKDTACVTVTAVSAVPQLPTLSGPLNPCFDSLAIYSATAMGSPPPTSFFWTIPNGLPFVPVSFDSIQINWNTVINNGQLCVTANNGCGASQPACIPINVLEPLVTPVISGPSSVCTNGGDYMYTFTGIQTGTTYNWTVPSGAVLTGSGDTVMVNFLNASSGQVCVVAQNSCAESAPVCVDVQVNPAPTASLTGSGEICTGDSLTLTFSLTGNGPFDVVWTDGTGNTTLNDISNGHTISVSPVQNTNYTLISVNDNSMPACSSPATDVASVLVWQHASTNLTAQICEGETILLGGAQQTSSGVYVDSLNTIHGCDSVVTTVLTVFLIDSLQIDLTTCDPALAGTTVQMLTQTNGCDSIVTTTVMLLPSDTTLISDKSCDMANVGVFTQVLNNQYGCDSTVVTTVIFSLSDTSYVGLNSCDLAQTGVFTQHLTNSEGCDSVIITTVSFLQSDTTLLTGLDCNPANVGVFTQLFSNQAGCDSLIITTISLNPIAPTFVSNTTCDPSMAGVFQQTIVTAAGCDSLVVTTIDLLPSDTTHLFGADCNPANVGVFTNVLSNQYGCDSTVITNISFVHLDSTFLATASCDPTQTGVFEQILLTSTGCDSVVITSVSLLPSDTTYLAGADCNPANVGTFTQVLSNQYGCDSTVVTTIVLLPSDATAVLSNTCDPAAAGVFTYNLQNQYGCDSIVTETVQLLPSSNTQLSFQTCDPLQVGSVTTVLSNQYGCDSTVVATTTLLPADNCSVTATLAGSTIPCGLNTGTLTLNPTLGIPPFDYTVTLGGSTVAMGSINAVNAPTQITGLAPGAYTVNVSSVNGYSASVQAQIVQLFPPNLSTNVTSNFNGFDISCTGEMDGSAIVNVSGGLSPFHYNWSEGALTQELQNIGAGMYTVTVTDANNCSTVASVTLTEPTPLSFNFAVNDLDCFGLQDGAIFVNATGGAPPYRYALGQNAPQSANAFTSLSAGAYTITTFDANDCQRTEVIVVNASVPLNVSLGDDQTIELGGSTILQAIVNVPLDSILSVVWTPPFDSAECDNCLTRVVAPIVSTTYSIQVEDVNGCSDSDQMIVIVDRRRYIYVPNVFSPNDDGFNDRFSIFAKDGTVVKLKNFQIFDRWGEQIYLNAEFLPNDPKVFWDGNYRGTALSPGVYVWYVEIEFIDGVIEVFKGDVTLSR